MEMEGHSVSIGEDIYEEAGKEGWVRVKRALTQGSFRFGQYPSYQRKLFFVVQGIKPRTLNH
jgi:hypothetical protein